MLLAVVKVKVKRIDMIKITWTGAVKTVALLKFNDMRSIVADSEQNVLVISILAAEHVPNFVQRAIEEKHDKHIWYQERRAKIALQRAINRINVGKID